MNRHLEHAVLVLLAASSACATIPDVPEGTISWAFTGGRWYDGEGFVARDMYAVGSTLVEHRPERVDSTLDVSGAWVIPPFGDAHTHNLDGPFRLAEVREAYRAEGTFYVQVLTNTSTGRDAVRDTFDAPGTLDVRYSGAGLTSTLGHPFLAYEPRALGIFSEEAFDRRREEVCESRELLGEAYWFVDDLDDLDAVWPSLLVQEPEVLKLFLLHSEAHSGAASCDSMGRRGLDPALVPDIVARAHAAGLRVWAHVESPHDFDVAVRAGVDGLAHLPGYAADPAEEDLRHYEIPPAAVRLAGERGVLVTPTVSWIGSQLPDTVPDEPVRDLARRNIRRLRMAGARFVVGSDRYGLTARQEVEAMRALGEWSDGELLRMWTVTTPRAIFPDRRIGALRQGREASFLVLECDPLADWECTSRIRDRMKEGTRLR